MIDLHDWRAPNGQKVSIFLEPAELPYGIIPVFESGAILVYLAAKTGKFLPRDTRAWMQGMDWLLANGRLGTDAGA